MEYIPQYVFHPKLLNNLKNKKYIWDSQSYVYLLNNFCLIVVHNMHVSQLMHLRLDKNTGSQFHLNVKIFP